MLVAALGIGYGVDAARGHLGQHTVVPIASATDAPTVALSALPAQAATTVHLIQAGGPFRYREDGEVFDNNQHRLPPEPLGWYHAYTVVTPGSPDRGERRIVTGRGGQFWYTADHYDTFRRVDVTR